MTPKDVSVWLETDHDGRDEKWEAGFLADLPLALVQITHPEPQSGPDHWPYLMVETTHTGGTGASGASSAEPPELMLNILHWLSGRGIGLALNAGKAMPDFVLSYGMVWNFRERGEFFTNAGTPSAGSKNAEQTPSTGRFEIKNGQQVWAGPPSEAYLPKYVRSIIKQFLMDQGVFAPKVLMVSEDGTNFDLCFSLESLKSPPAHEHANIAEALAWFLPAHYSVSLLSEKTLPGFVAL